MDKGTNIKIILYKETEFPFFIIEKDDIEIEKIELSAGQNLRFGYLIEEIIGISMEQIRKKRMMI